MKRDLLRLAALGLVLLAANCKDSGPTAGEFSVSLATPNQDDGAIQFTASANTPATITAVTAACSGCKLFIVKISDSQYKGVLTGTISAGTIFRIGVSDKKNVGTYSVVINSVAARNHVVRGSTTGYSVTLAP